MKQEPLVPIGCLLTVAAFTNAYRAMRRGDHAGVQRMFRARVAAQGFTVAAMMAGGLYFSAQRHREKELYKVQQQLDEEEKRQRWIRELEARDEEDRALRERLERRRKRAAERAEGQPPSSSSFSSSAAGDGEKRPLDAEQKEGSGVLGSLGGFIGGSGASKSSPDTPSSDSPSQQPVNDGSTKK